MVGNKESGGTISFNSLNCCGCLCFQRYQILLVGVPRQVLIVKALFMGLQIRMLMFLVLIRFGHDLISASPKHQNRGAFFKYLEI